MRTLNEELDRRLKPTNQPSLDERFARAEDAMAAKCEQLEAKLSAKVGQLSDRLDASPRDGSEADTGHEICQLRDDQDRAKRELSDLCARALHSRPGSCMPPMTATTRRSVASGL
jgi:hypothetical protein